jgi:hypothetical protein
MCEADPVLRPLLREVLDLAPEHVYFIEDAAKDNHLLNKAFDKYFFSAMLMDLGRVESLWGYPPRPFDLALEYGTQLIMRGTDSRFFLPMGYHAEDTVWRVRREGGDMLLFCRSVISPSTVIPSLFY